MFTEKSRDIKSEIFELERIIEEYKKQKNKLQTLQNVLLQEHNEYIEKTLVKNFMKKLGIDDVYINWKFDMDRCKHVFRIFRKQRARS